MTPDDTDVRLAAELAAYEARIVPDVAARGGPAARATVARRRRRTTAALAAAVVVLVAAGLGLVRTGTEEDRLVPAVSPSAAATTASPPPPSPPPGPLDNATIDFSRLPEEDCGGPTVQMREGNNYGVRRLDTIFTYYVDRLTARGDLDGDGRDEHVAILGCVGEGGGLGRSWVMVLTGDLPRLAVADRLASLYTANREHEPEVTGIAVEGSAVNVQIVIDGKPDVLRLAWSGERSPSAGTN